MKRLTKGQSLFELVVALAISALIIVAMVSLASTAIKGAAFSRNKTIAARYAQEATEWLRGQRDADPELFSEKALIPVWCLNTLSWDNQGPCSSDSVIGDTRFTRTLTFTLSSVDVGGVTKTLTTADVSVEWGSGAELHEVRTTTDFADWRQR